MINEEKFRKLLADKPTPELDEAPTLVPGQVYRSTITFGACTVPGFEREAGINRVVFKVLEARGPICQVEILASDGVWVNRNDRFQEFHAGSPFGIHAEVVPEKLLNPPERKYVEKFTLKYRVTKNDIAKGERGACKACPQALAIDRAFRAKFRRLRGTVNSGVRYFVTSLIYEPGNGDQNVIAYKAKTPATVRAFFQDFDHRAPVAPGEFEIEFERFRGVVNIKACEVDA